MMDELVNANYIADLKSIGRKDKLLSITGKAGDNIFIRASLCHSKQFYRLSDL